MGSKDKRPILGSIGTVLIDSFDRPPRPCVDCVTRPADATTGSSTSPTPSITAFLAAIPSVRATITDDFATGPPSPSPTDTAGSSSIQSSSISTASSSLSASFSSERHINIPPPPLSALTLTAIQPHSQSSSSHFNLSPPSTATTRQSGARTPQLDFDSSSESSVPPEESYDVLGGGALYALIGARIWLPADELRTLVDRKGKRRADPEVETDGSDTPDGNEQTPLDPNVAEDDEEDDLPKELEQELHSYGEQMWVWNRTSKTRMTRARIRYDGDVRLFQHVVKAPKRTLASLKGTPIFGAEYLHIAPPSSPEDVCELLEELRAHNARVEDAQDRQLGAGGEQAWYPKIVFEPAPPSCHPGQRHWLEQSLHSLAVLSPNHEELLSIYSEPIVPLEDPSLGPKLESIIKHILDVGIGPGGTGTVIVRCGREGSYVGTRSGGVRWFPAGFTSEEEYRVKDVTGAGNAFLGGLVAGLSLSGDDPYEAVLYATMSASFTIEQFGLPELRSLEDGTELWNGELPRDRLEQYRARLRMLKQVAQSDSRSLSCRTAHI